MRGEGLLLFSLLLTACGEPAPRSSAAVNTDPAQSAATKEGKIVLAAPNYDLWKQALGAFTQDYPDIKIESTEFNSRDFWVKLDSERKAGQYLWDLRIGGPDPQVFEARDAGALDPVQPLLRLPEVTDSSKWFGGIEGLYADKSKQFLPVFVAEAGYVAYVNRDIIPESALKTEDQLLDPRWQGKIAIQDPSGGAGLGSITTLLVAHGESYLRDFLSKQKPVVTRDQRQLAEWVIRNRYPIGVGVAPTDLTQFQNDGLRFNVKGLDFPRKLSMGSGGIQLINRAPHPNATRLYLNWLLSAKAQALIAKTAGVNSRRLDVPPGNPDGILDPTHMQDYVPHQSEELLPQRTAAAQMAKELLR
ncbi:MAG TPA: extracellular solute-binding protein [Chloroflexota bacterium]